MALLILTKSWESRRENKMVTKIELQKKANDELVELRKKLEVAMQKHKSFEREDEAEREHYRQCEKLRDKIEALMEKRWVGNWEERDNWYHGNIPVKLKDLAPEHSHEREILKNALKELADKKEEEIKKSEVYKQLNKELDGLRHPIKNPVHRDLEEEIEDLQRSISWNERRLRDIEDKGEFIQICIREKKYAVEKERHKRDEELKAKFKEIISQRAK